VLHASFPTGRYPKVFNSPERHPRALQGLFSLPVSSCLTLGVLHRAACDQLPGADQPINRKVMATALRGTKVKGKVKTPGICALLGLRPFTPHDLRRTAATLAGDLGFDDAWIAKCLDHATSKKQEQAVPTVTGKVYNHSKRMKEKRAVLDGVAAELRRIIGEPAKQAQTELRLVA
jgi:hypothetical protein